MEPKETSGDIERRTITLSDINVVRAATGDGVAMPPSISGHAAVFNVLSADLGGFREIILPGAFTESLQTGDIRALFNHDPNLILGRNHAGTLSLAEDDRGLAIKISPPDTNAARDLMVSMERGDVTQMSFGFRTIEDKWEIKDGADIRTLIKVELFDVSAVTYPAYPSTDVAVRALNRNHEARDQAAMAAVKTTAAARSRALDLAAAEI